MKRLVYTTSMACIAVAVLLLCGCPQEMPWIPIHVENADFSLPDPGSDTILSMAPMPGWEMDSWAGRVQYELGEFAAFADRHHGGEGNGFTQTLDSTYESGEYRLSVMSGSWNTAIESRIILGYIENTDVIVLSSSDLSPSTTENPDWYRPIYWDSQILTITVDENSGASGKPIWIRLTGLTDVDDVDPTFYDDFNLWDDVRLEMRVPTTIE